ncbi:hypothetical protein BC827DRAFT_327513 [Russula dissimulans]|nr:hypothetical protein BC827DRAFT_327513 [Russula dissimulans]
MACPIFFYLYDHRRPVPDSLIRCLGRGPRTAPVSESLPVATRSLSTSQQRRGPRSTKSLLHTLRSIKILPLLLSSTFFISVFEYSVSGKRTGLSWFSASSSITLPQPSWPRVWL